MKLQKISESRSLTDALSESQLKRLNRTYINLSDIDELLSTNNIKFMIIGAHALGEVIPEPRATKDVDIIIKDEDYIKTKKLILTTFPGTKADGNRIKDEQGHTLIDILTDSHLIYKTAFATGQKYPTPEMIAVMKFLSSHSQLRQPIKKMQDKVDFFNVVSNNNLDMNKMLSLLKSADPEFILNKDNFIKWNQQAKIN